VKRSPLLAGLLLGGILCLPQGVAADEQIIVLEPPLPGPTKAAPPPPAPGSVLGKLVQNDTLLVVTRRRPLAPIPVAGGKLIVNAVGAFEPGFEQKRLLGLRMDLHPTKGPTTVVYMDLGEVDDLARAMNTLGEVVQDAVPGLVTEADYATLEGLVVGVAVDDAGPRHYVRFGNPKRAHWNDPEPPSWEMSGKAFAELRKQLGVARTALFN